MKLHILTHELNLSGAPRTAQEVANHMHRQGYETNVVIVGGAGEINSILNDEIQPTLLKCHKKGKLKTIGYILSSLVRIGKYLKAEKPEFMMTWGKEFTLITTLLCKLLRFKTVVVGVNVNMIEHHIQTGTKKRFMKSIKRQIYKTCMPMTEAWIAQSEGLVDEMHGVFKINKDNLKVVYPAIQKLFYETTLPEKYNKSFVFVGRLVDQKDPDRLIKNCARFLTENKDWTLELVGEGYLQDNLEILCKKLNVTEQVKFIGAVNDITPHVKGKKALLLTSKFEGFGMVLAEAAALGTPLLSINCPSGPSEIIQHGKNGYLAETDEEFQNFLTQISTEEFKPSEVRSSVDGFKPDTVLKCYEETLMNYYKQFMKKENA